MAWRRPNSTVALRCGAVVVLLAAGTLTAIVVSEWPRTGEMVAVRAVKPAAAPTVHPQPRTTLDFATLMPAAPDPFGSPMPPLVVSGGAEESRREARQIADANPPTHTRGPYCGNSDPPTYIDLDEYIEWWKTTANGRLFDEVASYDPARRASATRLSPQLDTTRRSCFGPDNIPSGTGVVYTESERPDDEAEAYDFTVRMDGNSVLPPTGPLGIGATSGLRAEDLFNPVPRDKNLADPAPGAGGDASVSWGAGSKLRASALGEAPGVIRDYVDLRLEQVWSVGPASSFSVGWRHLRGIVSNELPEPTVRQDALLLELKFGF